MSEFETAEDLNTYVLSPESELARSYEVNGYTIRATYRPTDLLVHQETEGDRYDSAKVNTLRRKYGSYYYFIISLSRNSDEALHRLEGGMSQYSEVLQTLSFRLHEYTTLTTSPRDTIPLSDFMLNRTYGLSQSTDVLLIFNREKAHDKDWVQLNLREFGLGVGAQRFRFSRKKLDEAPQINFAKSALND